MNDREILFPILGDAYIKAIPRGVLEKHERQADRNHSQTLRRLAERGGLSPCEAVAVIENREWRKMTDDDARVALLAHVRDWRNPPKPQPDRRVTTTYSWRRYTGAEKATIRKIVEFDFAEADSDVAAENRARELNTLEKAKRP